MVLGLGRPLPAALAVWAAVCFNEALSFKVSAGMGSMLKTRARSKEDIMANMTQAAALRTVMGMQAVKSSPELLAVLQQNLGGVAGGKAAAVSGMLRGRAEAGQARAVAERDDPHGYGELKNTMEMMNDMMKQAQMNLDLTESRCESFERNQMLMMSEAQGDVATFNGMAAEARGEVLDAQAQIGLLLERIPQIEAQLAELRATCSNETATLRAEISVLTHDKRIVDEDIMPNICKDWTPTQPPASSAATPASLLDCAHCAPGGLIMLQDEKLHPLMAELASETSRALLQQRLRSAFEELPHGVALTQQQVQRHVARVRSLDRPGDIDRVVPPENLTLQPEPVPPAKVDCVPTTKCVLKEGSCGRLKEKFELVAGELGDKLQETDEELVTLERFCESGDRNFSAQLLSLGTRLRDEQAKLAQATTRQIDSETSAGQKGRLHAAMAAEYTDTMTTCCEETDAERSEMCALTKIRGELLKMNNKDKFVVDCKVSEWSEGECSVSCGGGRRTKTREVEVPADGGMECPPLEEEMSCNDLLCPVDCIVDDWSGWSACSADCGGGVKERSRAILRQMAHDGEPCPATEETEVCYIESCDRDCVLGDWTPWGPCNKACGGGSRGKLRPVAVPATGTGVCPEAHAEPERLQFEVCNDMECESLVPPGRTFLYCNTKTDVIILLDSSGSLGQEGWELTKLVTEVLVWALTNIPDADVQVGLLVFSSSGTHWVKHLNQGATWEDVQSQEWMQGGTWTSQALGMAQEDFRYGREDASSVVVAITDGWPSSQLATKQAANELQETARVIWLPVGPGAPVHLIEEMASLPVRDHMFYTPDFYSFATVEVVNKIVSNVCPQVA